MSDFQLGQRVAYSTHLQRKYNDHSQRVRGKLGKEWSTTAYGDVLLPGGEGVIVGKRTLSNGNVSYPYEYGTPEYTPKVAFTAYLIAYSLQRKPVHVLPEHITALAEPAAPDDDDQHFKDTGCDSSLHPDDCLATKQGVLL